MNYSIFKLGIIRESRIDEYRTPLIPNHIKELKKLFPEIIIVVQPSNKRCFSDLEFLDVGAIINENLNSCDLILGVKEIDNDALIKNKKYLFFSHISKIQSDNLETTPIKLNMNKKKFLKEILNKNISLIDYENIRDDKGRRYLGFGRFAGIVGCYNSLALYENFSNNIKLPRAFEIKSYSALQNIVQNTKFSKIKILVTGDGRVSKGVLELLQFTNIKQVSKNDYINKVFNQPIFCNLKTSDYVKTLNDEFSLKDFIDNPKKYRSVAHKYLEETHLLISAHYWDPISPKIFDVKNLKQFKKLKVIGDITCDIDGSIPTTIKSTSIEDPYFYINKNNNNQIQKTEDALAVMAIDNLPSELPKDSSEDFGNNLLKEVLPYIIQNDDGRIKNATITENGIFLSNYIYLKKFISQ